MLGVNHIIITYNVGSNDQLCYYIYYRDIYYVLYEEIKEKLTDCEFNRHCICIVIQT